MLWSALTGKLERARALDPAATVVTGVVDAVLPPGQAKDALHGRWLGHPLHPLLVALPIGLFSGATLLDLTAGRGARPAAQRLVGAGLLSVLPTAAAGLADWSALGAFQRPKRVGLVHAAANVVSTTLYGASWLARRRGDAARGQALALAGLAGLSAGGYLGGHLAFAQAVGVDRNADAPKEPREWTDVAAAQNVPEGALVRVEAAGQPVVLLRRAGAVYAMAATCSHYGAPLEDGEVVLQGEDACLQCPWHGSRFRIADGSAARGPATFPQTSYDVRDESGRLQVRVRL